LSAHDPGPPVLPVAGPTVVAATKPLLVVIVTAPPVPGPALAT
jgi:hypothetical protein